MWKINANKFRRERKEIYLYSGVNVKYVIPLIYDTIKKSIPIIEQKLDEIHKDTFNDRINKMNRELRLLNNKLTSKKRNKDGLLDVLLSESITTLVFTEKNNELDIEINGLEKMIENQINLIAQN